MAADDDDWQGIEEEISDPEEIRVIYMALDSFFQYAHVAHFNVTHLRRQSLYALPEAHWKLLKAPPFNYLNTLDRVDEAIKSNSELARAIGTAGLASFRLGDHRPEEVVLDAQGLALLMPGPWAGTAKHSDIDKARSTLRQFYRDWSAAGSWEREACYGPVKRFMEEEAERRAKSSSQPSTTSENEASRPDHDPQEEKQKQEQQQQQEETGRLKVLVPGAGLGRLVFDLCDLGYEAEGNEISYHQLLASSYVLNRTERAGQHTIFPWVHSFSNHATRANQLRSYPIPDVHPATARESPTVAGGSMSMSAADFLCLYEQEDQRDRFDVVACVFFLDTAPNLIRYLLAIRNCLRPGGALVNVGPVLWHFENNAPGNHGRDDDGDGEHEAANSSGIADPGSFELTDDEVLRLVESLGFEIVRVSDRVTAPYIHDPESLLTTVYRASSWVARKRTNWKGDL